MMPSRPSATPTSETTTSYWCYSCTRFISVSIVQNANAGYVSCPHCNGGFIEEIEDSSASEAPATTPVSQIDDTHRSVIRRRRSNRRTSFNPVIVLHGGAGGERVENEGETRDRRPYEFYYDDGSGSGLRPLPDSVSEILMGSGFERLLEQLGQIEASGNGIIDRSGNPPASKSAIESLPLVEIGDCHVKAEANCAVCTEVFDAGAEGREMPCKHIFHGDCIVPWLSIRNSCPVCRFELDSDPVHRSSNEEEQAVGMTIWRLPGGGFAVGRFNAAMREGERVLPVVLTEVDGGGLGSNEGPRRISWVRDQGTPEVSRNGARSGRLRRAARGMVSFMRRMRPTRGSSSPSNVIDLDTDGESRVMNRSRSLIRRFF